MFLGKPPTAAHAVSIELLLLLLAAAGADADAAASAVAAATALSQTDYDSAAREVRAVLQSLTIEDEDGKPYHHLVATFIRLAVSDCARDRCDGCVAQPRGGGGGGALTYAIETLEAVRRRSSAASRMSRADLWALAAVEAINFGVARANAVNGADRRLASIRFRYGRRDCTTSPYATAPAPPLDPHATLDGVTAVLKRLFGLDERLAIAALGGHSVGTLRRDNTANAAFANWVSCADCFDNGYFGELADASLDWRQMAVQRGAASPTLYVWRHGRSGTRFMFNCDMSLMLNFSVADAASGLAGSCSRYRQCPMSRAARWVLLYSNDYDAWMRDFERAFAAIIERGYGPDELSDLDASSPPLPAAGEGVARGKNSTPA